MNDIMSQILSKGKVWIGTSKTLFIGVLCMLVSLSAYAQDITVNGTVIDDTGEPLIGATVMVDGTKIGAQTDLDGNFTLKVKPGAKLRISYVGYETQTVAAKDGMTVTMTSNIEALSGVEVVAYGVQKKVTVTGALSSVSGADITRTPVSSVNNVLAGQLSGVTTVQYSGEPGSDAADVFVRGKATWEGSAPLIQVDGVERSMADINPEDIETITVLKDASATAVFGVRGANGVVLITTKRGAEGQAKIDVSTSFSVLTPTKLVDQASSYQYATFYNMQRQLDNEALGVTGEPMFSQAIIDKFVEGTDPRFPSMRWTDYTMKDATLQTMSNVNISGGTKRARYFVSAGLMTQGGLFKQFDSDFNFGYGYNRFNYRSNLDLDVTSTTTVSFNIAGMVSNADKPLVKEGASALLRSMYQATPFSSPGIIDGKFITNTTDAQGDGLRLPFVGGNGLQYINNNGGGAIATNINKLQGDLIVKQKLDFITKGLDFHVKGSYNSQFNVVKTRRQSMATFSPYMDAKGQLGYRKAGENGQPSFSEDTGPARDWYFEAGFNWNRTFGPHTVTALALYNQSKAYYPSTFSEIPQGYVGLVGRVTYDYSNRYLAEVNVGYNGSENFHPDKRFGLFPAGSIGWIVSNEKFWEPLSSWFNFFKLRASLGLVGNDKIGGSRFMYTPDPFTVGAGGFAARSNNGYNFGIDNSTVHLGAYENSKNNPNVGWEKALKQDYGVDLNFFNSQLRATFDYYRERRTDILLRDLTAPNYIGFAVPYANLGEVKSWGWELSLTYNAALNKDWRLWTTLNISNNNNKVVEKKEAPKNNEFQYEKGYRIGSRSMYEFFEFYEPGVSEQRYEQKYGEKWPTQLIDVVAGDATYVDLDHNGVIDPNDMTHALGYTDDPEYILGLNLGASYKGLTLSMQWTGAWNVSRVIGDVFRTPFTSRTDYTTGGLLEYHYNNTWNPERGGQDYDYPRPTFDRAHNNNYAESTLYEKDSKYLRLKTIQLSYDLKAPFIRKVGLSNVQIALSGYNLLTFSPYIWGDPEQRASATPTYPLQRTYTLSLKLNF